MTFSTAISIVILAATTAMGCSSSTRQTSRMATIEVYDSSPITLLTNPEDSLSLSALVPVPSIGSAYARTVLFYSLHDGTRDSVMLLSEASGAADRVTNTRLFGSLPSKALASLDKSSIQIGLEQGSIIRIHPAAFAPRDTSALTLTPFVSQGDEGAILIGVMAKRNRKIDGEYLPSSEDLRITIRSGFKVLWQSNQGMAFLTVISPVRPENVGEQSMYQIEWDGSDISGSPLPPGTYTADLLIPSKPAPYRSEITFTWPLKKN